MVDMKTLTIDSQQFEIVDAEARTRLNELQSAVGSPLVASTVSAMTDHNKVYVYTGSESGYTSGNWYYWNGTAWTSGGVYNAVAIETDDTLSIADMAADAKATGDEITDLKSNVDQSLDAYLIEWTENAYIKTNVSAGTTVSLTPSTLSGYRCAVVDCVPGDKFTINAVGKSTPRAWAFLDSNNALLSVSATMTTCTDYLLTAPSNAAKLVLNDAPEGGVFNTISLKGVYISDTVSCLKTDIRNNKNGIYGGENGVFFEQGSASFVDGILTPSNSNTVVRLYDLSPVYLTRNTEIAVGTGFLVYVAQTRETVDGYERVQNTTSGYVGGTINIPINGLFFMFVKKENSGTITPEDAEDAIVIKHIKRKTIDTTLPKNPYKNIVWSNVRDITSVSHTHCTTQEHFLTLKAKYDHVAISNYHPSVPYYPLSNYFTDTDGVLASPNAEHFSFDDVAASVHINSVGGVLASEDAGFDGTLFDGIEDGYNSLIVRNGGGITLNHPKWSGLSATEVENIISFGGVFAIEIWNATCEQLNGTGYALDIWDSVLSDGIQVFGTCVPDHEAQYRPAEDRHPFGYNHMLVINGTEDEILHAYRTGKFYGTLYNDGLTLESYTLSNGQLSIEVSEASTFVFKTATRSVSVDTAAKTATFAANDTDVFVRCEVSRGSNKLFTNAIIL